VTLTGRVKQAYRAASAAFRGVKLYSPEDRGWQTFYAGRPPFAFQTHTTPTEDNVTQYVPVFACVTLIASDLGKLALRLMEKQGGIWVEAKSAAFSPVLRKPNHYQTRQQFVEQWGYSKLLHGNTYGLKQRDERGVVQAMYVLDPCRIRPLVADNGSVFYEVQEDDLSGVPQRIAAVPASEIIHDRFNCLFHPLVGLSPLYAAMLPALQGLKIQTNSEDFFENRATPGGVLSAPAQISDEVAARLKAHWDSNYTGANSGKIAVLGDGLKFEPMTMTAQESQMAEQLGMTAEMVCAAFHVPPWKVHLAPPPPFQSGEFFNQVYYNDCLQTHIEAIENCLDDGLSLPARYRAEFDLDGLLRMDSATQMTVLGLGVDKALMAPNEGRQRLNLPPVQGGKSPMIQQQNYSLEALAKRDAGPDPFGTNKPTPAAPPASDAEKEVATQLRLLKAMFHGATA
jgi:HK97 family phage portal protein